MAATVIQRIEKDFYLNELFRHRIPLCFRFNRQEYTMMAAKDPNGRLCLQSNRPVTGLRPGSRMDLLFDFLGQLFQFTVKAEAIRGKLIVASGEPDFLRKDLERSFVRVAPPEGLRVEFVFQEERYALDFPRIDSYEPVRLPPGMADRGSGDLKAVIQDLKSWAGGTTDGCKAVIFSTAKPRRLEELLVAKTGLTLYIPSLEEGLVNKEAGPEGRILTRERFLREFERLGYEPAVELLHRIIKEKADRGVYSEVWSPVRFQEYVLGYVYLWTMRRGKSPLDYQAVERTAEFTKAIAYAFKEGGRLETRRVRDETFEMRVLDISTSGLRFSYSPSKPGLILPPGVELGVTLETPGWRVRTQMRIVRRVPGRMEMGGVFLSPATGDRRVLFEYLYGETFSAGKQPFLTGEV
jgi:hypothetical protein